MSAEELPEGWVWATLGEVVVSKVVQSEPKGATFKYIDISAVDRENKKIRDVDELSTEAAPSRARQRVRAGDILVSMTRPNLNAVAMVPPELDGATASTGFDVLRAVNVMPAWLFAHVRSSAFVEEMSALVQGALYPAVSSADVRSSAVPIAPLKEQQRIVACIEALQARSDAARAALDAIPPRLEKLRRSILAAAFRGDLTREWRAKHPDVEPATALLERIRAERKQRWEAANPKKKYVAPEPVDESELPDLPEGWCWASVEELTPAEFSVVYGIILPGPHVEDGVPFVRPADIDNGQVRLDALPRTSPEIADKYRRAALKPGDLVFSIVGTIGKWLIVPEWLDGANITQSSVRIRPLAPLDATYFLRALQGPALEAQIAPLLFGNAVQRLNVEHVRRLAVPLMPREEWAALSVRLEASLSHVQTKKALAAQVVESLAQLNQSILTRAFRGELVPQDPSDEPAETLLARNRAERGATEKPRRGRRAGA